MKIYSLTGSYKSEFEGGLNLIGGEITSNQAIILKGSGYVHITQSLFTVPLLSTSEADLFGPDYGNIYYDTGSEDYRAYSSRGEWESILLSGDVDDTTIGYSGSSQLEVKDGGISYEKIDDEFTTSDTLTAGASVNIDFDAAQVFTLTPNQATTLNITNPKVGISKAIIVTGAGSSYTLAFTVGGASGTFNLIAGEYDDTSSTKNFIQILCVSSTEFWYSISQIAT